MESIFIVNTFESGWDIEALEIPDEKIYGTEMISDGMLEIVLTGIKKSELSEDWYINLNRVCA